MAKEHETQTVRWQCKCGAQQTGFIPKYGGALHKLQCPTCGMYTAKRNLHILITYPAVTFKPGK